MLVWVPAAVRGESQHGGLGARGSCPAETPLSPEQQPCGEGEGERGPNEKETLLLQEQSPLIVTKPLASIKQQRSETWR